MIGRAGIPGGSHLPDHRLPNRIEQPILAAEVVIDLRLVGVGVGQPVLRPSAF
jgi:hypothetical protein